MKLTVVSALLAVRQPASGEPHSHGVTGGVYKTRERIHRDIADPRLLAISDFMQSSCRLQSGLRRTFWDWLPLAGWQPSVCAIV